MGSSKLFVGCGIDPGLSGAVAFCFSTHPERVAVFDMPTVDGDVSGHELARLLQQFNPDFVTIELVASRPGQGVSSVFKFGKAFGTAIGVVNALRLPVHYVSPQRWKKHFRLSSDKEESRRMALDLWPACSEHFARKRDEGRSEAALIARYGVEVAFKNSTVADAACGAAGEGVGVSPAGSLAIAPP
jgi:crossover junction endodeoxyribonuclease RuvC